MQDQNPKQQTTKGCLALSFGLIIIVSIIVYTCSGDDEPERVLTKQEIRKNKLSTQFNGLDGSHINVTEKIKSSLNDPKSYEHIQTTYMDLDSSLVITTTFTAKNGFGGVIKQEVVVSVDTLGNILEIHQWFK